SPFDAVEQQDSGELGALPHAVALGAKIRDTIDEAIRLRDKVLLVLSETSLASDWVEDEVEKGFAEERRRGMVVLFPIRVDEAVRETQKAWARKLQDTRHIGDFRRWKEHDAYQKTLDRLLRDLRVEGT
ncbi:MAG: toll/interleukin-1 receptor domain-containing protein, partial [Acetobacteraceae bacterium]|nr:toll/interleukin-1 receptor domain-containing protein [Acetobacteraceae bacterium]